MTVFQTILLGISAFVFIFTGITDLKERMIFVFPIYLLSVPWTIDLFISKSIKTVFLFLLIVFGLFIWLKCLEIRKINFWGDGDTDVSLLFILVIGDLFKEYGLLSMSFYSAFFFSTAMIFSLILYFLCRWIFKDQRKTVAVTTGFSVPMIGLFVRSL